jgi:hypothetical protein
MGQGLQERTNALAARKSSEDSEANLPIHLRAGFHASGHKYAIRPEDMINAPDARPAGRPHAGAGTRQE